MAGAICGETPDLCDDSPPIHTASENTVSPMDTLSLTERGICTKYIPPAILAAGWSQLQFREASGLELDAFYRQLKAEMAHGLIVRPEMAYLREVAAG